MSDKGGEIAKGIVAPLTDSVADIYGVILGDRIANWRLKNVMRAHEKVHDEADKLGLKIRADKVPNRFAFAWFEAASKHDDDNLQTLFARLFARAAGETQEADERLIHMLSRFSPVDAQVFSLYYSLPSEPDFENLFKGRARGTWNSVQRESFSKLVEKRHPKQAEATIEALLSYGSLTAYTEVSGNSAAYTPNHDDMAYVDWDRLVTDRTIPVDYVNHTELGRRLAAAVLDDSIVS